ncbi:MAG: hypothetical protein IJY21_02805 [Clostridia bacterium]|nr:hypothetical protein [Clostridia bacterium]
MRKAVSVKTYAQLPDYDRREILRYAGARGEADERLQELLDQCLTECNGVFTPRACCVTLPRTEFFDIFPPSENAKAWTDGCENITVFTATVGLGIDRLINRYASVSTTKALLFQAIGAERIERLCDVFCAEQSANDKQVSRRFSPGYGDFPLTAQRGFFALLNPQKHIGVTLTESLLMSPTKSVTAAFGIKSGCEKEEQTTNCQGCNQKDCVFKRD